MIAPMKNTVWLSAVTTTRLRDLAHVRNGCYARQRHARADENAPAEHGLRTARERLHEAAGQAQHVPEKHDGTPAVPVGQVGARDRRDDKAQGEDGDDEAEFRGAG
jgi:hypothetical protein